jgi:hypothetical protein
LRLVALGRVARLGPLGLVVAAYGVWRQLPAEDKERVLGKARSLVRRVRSRATAAPLEPLEPRAWTAGEA